MGGLFSAPKTPALKETPVMPTPDDTAVTAARRRAIADQMMRGGRKSTQLSSGYDETASTAGATTLGGS